MIDNWIVYSSRGRIAVAYNGFIDIPSQLNDDDDDDDEREGEVRVLGVVYSLERDEVRGNGEHWGFIEKLTEPNWESKPIGFALVVERIYFVSRWGMWWVQVTSSMYC